METREIEPGRVEVTDAEGSVVLLLPAGVGIPGVGDEEVAAAIVTVLRRRGRDPGAVADVAFLLRDTPTLLDEAAEVLESDA